MSNTNVTILSPHLDDAALSLCDHILKLTSSGFKVTVINIFTSFSQGDKSTTRLRVKEDAAAMSQLGVKIKNLGFTDAGFRKVGHQSVYPDFRHIFMSHPHQLDSQVVPQLVKRLSTFPSPSRVYLPFGLGGHVDHILTRQAGETVYPNSQINYYLEAPYFLNFKNWSVSKFFKVLRFPIKSIIPQSTQKPKIIACYASQVPLLFPKSVPTYPEVVLSS